jgi:hypothetical protein
MPAAMSGHAEKIYVQIDIRSSIERVWCLTQTPDLHQRWDLRFTEISYLPRADASLPQRFLYATRIGFGLNIRGEGESVGSCDSPGGERSSALRFWSQDPKSLIREGSGYWKYIPLGEDGQTIRFLTLYDYEVRFNALGRVLDRLIFRPLIGWATAWSFDRLRLWIEKDIDPAASMRHSVIYLMARITLALVWVYQGVVPKLILRHPGELGMLRALGLSDAATRGICIGIGGAEVGIGLMLVVAWRFRWPLWLTLLAMPAALLAVAIKSPEFLGAPFNPVSLNLAVFALAAIALLIARDLPSASHCVRRLPRGEA